MNTEIKEITAPKPRFEVIGDGMVNDHNTGLIWTQSDVGDGRLNHQNAMRACADLSLGGHADWRLPAWDELLSLIDVERYRPAINIEFFPGCKSSYYRTGTPYQTGTPVLPSTRDYVWGVNFGSGNLNGYTCNSSGFVRAVRSSG